MTNVTCFHFVNRLTGVVNQLTHSKRQFFVNVSRVNRLTTSVNRLTEGLHTKLQVLLRISTLIHNPNFSMHLNISISTQLDVIQHIYNTFTIIFPLFNMFSHQSIDSSVIGIKIPKPPKFYRITHSRSTKVALSFPINTITNPLPWIEGRSEIFLFFLFLSLLPSASLFSFSILLLRVIPYIIQNRPLSQITLHFPYSNIFSLMVN